MPNNQKKANTSKPCSEQRKPLVINWRDEIDYEHSYAQDSPFYAALAEKKLLGSACTECKKIYATPRKACITCGVTTQWIELPKEGTIHTFTTCHYGGETFLEETLFTLILVEFENVDTLFLSRLVKDENIKVQIGMRVKPKFVENPRFLITDVYFVPGG